MKLSKAELLKKNKEENQWLAENFDGNVLSKVERTTFVQKFDMQRFETRVREIV